MTSSVYDISIPDFNYSRPLDVHRWSDYSEVNDFVNEIYLILKSMKGHENTGKKLVKVLLLDLYVAWSADPDLMIMFSRNNNSYKAKSRYNELHVGRKIIDIVDALVSEGIIFEKRGFNDRRSGISFQSRLWSSDWLKNKFKAAKFNQFHVQSPKTRESIILRDEDKRDIDRYIDTEETIRMRQVLRDYNELLSNSHIDIFDLDKPVTEIIDKKKRIRHIQINQQDKFVRRVFNNGRWDKGGRFYGGWWQRCPREHRLKISMDGWRTSEVDYSGLHIVILYAQEGINYWADVNEDPYQLHGINNIDPEVDLRAAAKLLLLTAINAEDEAKSFRAFRFQAAKGTLEKKMTDEQLGSLLSALRRKHEPIAHKLASGAGIDLMYVDSQIAEKIISFFIYDCKCPILSVHDSFVVPYGYDRFLEQSMQSAFEEVTGITHPVVKHTSEYYDTMEEELDLNEPEATELVFPHLDAEPCERHIQELKLFKEFKGKPDTEPWVPDWSMVY